MVIPLIGRYLLFTMFLVSFSIAISVVTLNFHRRWTSIHLPVFYELNSGMVQRWYSAHNAPLDLPSVHPLVAKIVADDAAGGRRCPVGERRIHHHLWSVKVTIESSALSLPRPRHPGSLRLHQQFTETQPLLHVLLHARQRPRDGHAPVAIGPNAWPGPRGSSTNAGQCSLCGRLLSGQAEARQGRPIIIKSFFSSFSPTRYPRTGPTWLSCWTVCC
jgi:hypothetical protein